MRKNFHIKIHRIGSNRSCTLLLPFFSAPLYTGLRTLVFVGILFAFAQFFTRLQHDFRLQNELNRQGDLYQKSRNLLSDLQGLEDDMLAFYQNADLLRLQYGWSDQLAKPLELGVGGPVDRDSLFGDMVLPLRSEVRKLGLRSELLGRQIEHGNHNFRSMGKFLEKKLDDWNSIPSVNPTQGHFTSGFGRRLHPVLKRWKLHAGMDIANEAWTPIIAPADGLIKLSKFGPAFGNYIVIDHGNGYLTKYGHLNQSRVHTGEMVKRHQVIGYMGKTGRTTGTHLHYELHKNGKPINPRPFLLPENYSID